MRMAPKFFQQFTKDYPQITKAYENLGKECRKAGPLNEREQALVKLSLAIGARMEGAVHAEVRKGLDAGLQPDEIRHAVFLALTSMGFPGMMAALSWVNDYLKPTRKRK